MRIGIGLPAAAPGTDMTTLGRWAAESEHVGLLGSALESAGFAWSAPDDPMREDEPDVVPVLESGMGSARIWSWPPN